MLLDNQNTLSGGGRTYVWDQQNRLTQVTKAGTTVNFTYRADGLRARKQVVGGLTIDYVYDGQMVVGEKRSDGKSVWYTPGPGGYINRTVVDDATGNVIDKEWYVYDGLGSCRAMVKPNAQGTDAVITARMDYDVYGKVRTQSGSTDSKFKYVAGIGHPTDEESGLIYMRARYYEPGTGRFVSEDPARDGGNWFAYANNSPTRYVDQSGEGPIEALAGTLWFAAGFLLVVVSLGLNSPQALNAAVVDFQEALVALLSVWKDFSIHLAVGISTQAILGNTGIGGMSRAIFDAARSTLQMIAWGTLVSALVPVATRMTLAVIGWGMMQWGAYLWTEV